MGRNSGPTLGAISSYLAPSFHGSVSVKRKLHVGAEPILWGGFQGCRFLKMFRIIWYHSWVFKLLLNNESLNPMARDGIPPYELLVRDAPNVSKTLLADANAPG